ncbi:PilZ domain-containing protein [Granulicella rosea]|nr:PilZ domain-containing protein [Granulicella rosea]
MKLVADLPRGERKGSWSTAGSTDPVRTAVRFPMQLAIRIKTEDGEIEAVTENISANGILFSGESLPAVDSRIEFTIDMPASVMGSASDVSIHCTGRVVRHQVKGDLKQAAAIIDEYFLKA